MASICLGLNVLNQDIYHIQTNTRSADFIDAAFHWRLVYDQELNISFLSTLYQNHFEGIILN